MFILNSNSYEDQKDLYSKTNNIFVLNTNKECNKWIIKIETGSHFNISAVAISTKEIFF